MPPSDVVDTEAICPKCRTGMIHVAVTPHPVVRNMQRNTFGSPKVVPTWRPAPTIVKSSTVHESSCPAGPNLITPRLCVERRSLFLRSVMGVRSEVKRSSQFRSRAGRFQDYPATCTSVCACRSSRQTYFAACCAQQDEALRQRGPCLFGTLGKSLRCRQRRKVTWALVLCIRRRNPDKLEYEV